MFSKTQIKSFRKNNTFNSYNCSALNMENKVTWKKGKETMLGKNVGAMKESHES